VDDGPDTNETEASKRNRPAYKSDAGRVVYGGGGIAPDLIVDNDTLTTAEQQLVKAIAPKNQDFYVTLYDFGLELSKQVQPGFTVQPAWREEFYNRLQKKGLVLDKQLYASGQRYIDRTLGDRISRFAQGDSSAKRRDTAFDRPLLQAISLLGKAQSQQDLFSLTTALAPAKGSKQPK
jgi:carboxyl-terminal processing protease